MEKKYQRVEHGLNTRSESSDLAVALPLTFAQTVKRPIAAPIVANKNIGSNDVMFGERW
jgi:hypothetical protein